MLITMVIIYNIKKKNPNNATPNSKEPKRPNVAATAAKDWGFYGYADRKTMRNG